MACGACGKKYITQAVSAPAQAPQALPAAPQRLPDQPVAVSTPQGFNITVPSSADKLSNASPTSANE